MGELLRSAPVKHRCVTPSVGDRGRSVAGQVWRCDCGRRWVLRDMGRFDYWTPARWPAFLSRKDARPGPRAASGDRRRPVKPTARTAISQFVAFIIAVVATTWWGIATHPQPWLGLIVGFVAGVLALLLGALAGGIWNGRYRRGAAQ